MADRIPAAARMIVTVAALAAASGAVAADAHMEAGRRLFTGGTTPACAICHTLKDAGATGAVGPVLDELQPDAARVVAAVKNGVGAMPSYKATLSEAQIQALGRYVAKASGASK